VILLDEIEKAHPDVFNILLQVLDDGRLTDNKGRTANFKNTIIIMTSNIGSHLIQDKFSRVTDENAAEIESKTKIEVFELLKKSIRPEFLNRIDEIMMFKPLSRSDIRGIVDVQFEVLKRMLENQGVEITASDEALDWLSEIGYDPQFGARPLKRAIQREVLNKLSIKILDSTITTDSKIKLDVNKKKEFMFDNLK
jgi:ATP-dependent Clp protease ATP-binding subunit ClpB